MHGPGTYTFSNGKRYSGTWAGGLMDGKGELDFGRDTKYVGDFHGGVPRTSFIICVLNKLYRW
jgi:hypothetical protein